MRITVGWLVSTYLLFLVSGRAAEAPDLVTLTLFVAATIVAFVIGYRARSARFRSQPHAPGAPSASDAATARRLIALSAAYYACYGLALLAQYGGSGVTEIVRGVLDPGTSYVARLRTSETFAGQESAAVQVLTLLAVASTPLVPFIMLYWRRTGRVLRSLALVGLLLYGAYWLYIGTLKGLGDISVYAGVALLVMRSGQWPDRIAILSRRRTIALGVVVALAFIGYMTYNQAERLAASSIAAYEPNPVVAAVFGEQIGRGFTVTLAYPSHGYLGLAHNLGTPFHWTEMRGSSRALDSYLEQYFGSESVADETYPARTESRTGWPAGMYWATIYPWLASDLTFPGAVVLMGLVGWWMAKLWYETAVQRDKWSLLLLCQVGILVAYIPANNQVVLTRPGLIGAASLAILYLGVRAHRGVTQRLLPASGTRVRSRPGQAVPSAQRSASSPALTRHRCT
ncbi:MAG: hypothetical protein JWP95_388 [Actinotalea sp.]|nr:hypothetical protein [Actinotalea sp.]